MVPSDFSIALILIFFVNGLAFFSMGLTMMLESNRSPLLAEARVLRPLAFFGLIHGLHEWLEMGIYNFGQIGFTTSYPVHWLRLGLLVASFSCVVIFGIRVLKPQHRRMSIREHIAWMALLAVYSLFLVLSIRGHLNSFEHWMEHADALARYILAVPGAALAALALNLQARQAQSLMRVKLAWGLRVAGWSFAIYSLTQLFVGPSDISLAGYLNTAVFLQATGMPIQMVRAAVAVSITLSLIHASGVVEEERQRQFFAAQQARLEALEQVQRELVERASMRRELLRHIVIAQEDERARIARELHDETSQYLTAFSLDLATLGNLLPKKRPAQELLTRLRRLARQMAQSIYRIERDLRPAQLDDLGLVAALYYLADEKRGQGLEVDLQVLGERQRLDPLVETVFFRVAQEALNNVSRHSGQSQASLTMSFAPQVVTLQVQDQGVGFDPQQKHSPPRGWGLAGMRERAESVGGQLHIQSSRGRGTLVEVAIPLADSRPTQIIEERHEYHQLDVGR